jgi:putative ABC transport system ATP-binding protein
VDGTEISALDERQRTELRRGQIGFIFQAFRLFHSLSAFENVMIAAEIACERKQQQSDAARQLLEI